MPDAEGEWTYRTKSNAERSRRPRGRLSLWAGARDQPWPGPDTQPDIISLTPTGRRSFPSAPPVTRGRTSRSRCSARRSRPCNRRGSISCAWRCFPNIMSTMRTSRSTTSISAAGTESLILIVPMSSPSDISNSKSWRCSRWGSRRTSLSSIPTIAGATAQ